MFEIFILYILLYNSKKCSADIYNKNKYLSTAQVYESTDTDTTDVAPGDIRILIALQLYRCQTASQTPKADKQTQAYFPFLLQAIKQWILSASLI